MVSSRTTTPRRRCAPPAAALLAACALTAAGCSEEPPAPKEKLLFEFLEETPAPAQFRGYLSGPAGGRVEGAFEEAADGTLVFRGRTEKGGGLEVRVRPLVPVGRELLVRDPETIAEIAATGTVASPPAAAADAGAFVAGWLQPPSLEEPVGYAHLEFAGPPGRVLDVGYVAVPRTWTPPAQGSAAP